MITKLPLTKKHFLPKILRIIQCLNEASDIASEFDTDYQRVLVFRNGLNTHIQPYKAMLLQLREKSQKQPEISNFLLKPSVEKETSETPVKTKMNSSKIATLFSKQVTKKFGSKVTSIHEGKKPFKCEICDDQFELKHELNEYIASVHRKRFNQHIMVLSSF